MGEIAAVVSGLLAGGGLTALVNIVVTRRKIGAEARALHVSSELLVADGALKVAEALRLDLERVLAENARLRVLNEKLARQVFEHKQE